MEKLEKYFENVEKIANSLELLVNEIIEENAEEKAEMAKQIAAAPVVPVQNTQPQVQVLPVQPQASVPAQQQVQTTVQASVQPQVVPVANVQVPQAPVTIPVANQAGSFTQEQIARAMANAAQAGRTDLVQNIFATFKVKTLMEINPANYNQVATMLREAGIQI